MLIAASSVSVFSATILGTEDKKLTADGLSVACNAAGVPIRNIKYYGLRYPNADKLMIVFDAQWPEGTDTFNIKLPSDFVFYFG